MCTPCCLHCLFSPPRLPCLVQRRRKERANKGRWTKEEHAKFLQGYNRYGKDWNFIHEFFVTTRTQTQIRTHAQKYLTKAERGAAFPQEVRRSYKCNEGTQTYGLTISFTFQPSVQVRGVIFLSPCTAADFLSTVQMVQDVYHSSIFIDFATHAFMLSAMTKGHTGFVHLRTRRALNPSAPMLAVFEVNHQTTAASGCCTSGKERQLSNCGDYYWCSPFSG